MQTKNFAHKSGFEATQDHVHAQIILIQHGTHTEGREAMPLYEFRCEKCNENFILKMTVKEREKKKTFKCPKCNGRKVKPVITSFSAITSKKS